MFETIRIEAGEPMALPAHLARLASSCAALGMRAPPPAALIAEEASRLVRFAPTGGLVRFKWSAGPADAPGPDDPPRGPSRLLAWRPGARLSPVALHPLSFRPGEHAAHKTTARWPYHRARVAAADAVWRVGASLTGPRRVARVGEQRWCAVAGCPPGAK